MWPHHPRCLASACIWTQSSRCLLHSLLPAESCTHDCHGGPAAAFATHMEHTQITLSKRSRVGISLQYLASWVDASLLTDRKWCWQINPALCQDMCPPADKFVSPSNETLKLKGESISLSEKDSGVKSKFCKPHGITLHPWCYLIDYSADFSNLSDHDLMQS